MTIKQGDFVRAINPKLCLPAGSVWVVACAQGGLRLRPFNNPALPAGWGTSPRRAPRVAGVAPTAASYKPAHGGYPGKVKA